MNLQKGKKKKKKKVQNCVYSCSPSSLLCTTSVKFGCNLKEKKNDVGAEEAMTPKLKHHHHQIRPGIFVHVRSRL